MRYEHLRGEEPGNLSGPARANADAKEDPDTVPEEPDELAEEEEVETEGDDVPGEPQPRDPKRKSK